MAGHSKWANIRHPKAAQDSKRGKIFTKLIRELVVAAKGGPEPADNPRLRAAVDKALGANMKRETVDKAIARGAGNADGDHYDELTYEGYAPGGVAILIECMTDNRNRTVSDIRHVFSKRGGNLGTDGSVSYLFTRQGELYFTEVDEEILMDAAIDAGAEDIEIVDTRSALVITSSENVLKVKDALALAGFESESAELNRVASVSVPLNAEMSATVMAMVDALEDLDDGQSVYTNAQYDESVFY